MLTILSQQNVIDIAQVLLLMKILSKHLMIFSFNIKVSNIIKKRIMIAILIDKRMPDTSESNYNRK